MTVEIVPAPLRRADIEGLGGEARGPLDLACPYSPSPKCCPASSTHTDTFADRDGCDGGVGPGRVPLVARRFTGATGHYAGRFVLVLARSTPEYMLAYILLQTFGPSMLPAINRPRLPQWRDRELSAWADTQIKSRTGSMRPSGLNLYAYDTLPRIYGQFLAYCPLPLGNHRA